MTTPPTEPPVGDPNQPQYGQVPYGQPTPPQYGQPAYGAPGGPSYGTPFVPGAQPPPSKAMAVTALVLALVGCLGISWLVSVVLSIVVLVKGKDGRAHGKGLAIAALVINLLWLLVGIALIVTGVFVSSNYESIEDLKAGQCINASGLSGSGDSVGLIKDIDCDKSHDAEVMATVKLTADEAAGYNDATTSDVCFTALSNTDGAADKLTNNPGVTILGLTQTSDPDPGDQLACVAFNDDGSKLSAPLE